MKNPKENGGNIDAFLGQNTTFNGTLIFDGLVRVDGNFEGNIKTSDVLVIANTGTVRAEIEAGVVKISGTFDGVITGKSKVELYKPAVVTGTIKAPAITIEEGVVFNGSTEMTQRNSYDAPTPKDTKKKETHENADISR